MAKRKRYDGVVYYKQSTRQLIYDHDGCEQILDNIGWRTITRLIFWCVENNIDLVLASPEEEVLS